MFIHSRTKDRPFHYGPFPLEGLARDDSVVASETMRAPLASADAAPADGLLAGVAQHYGELFARFADGPVAAKQAPLPDDLARRATDIKGAAYFLDASQVGICRIPESAWLSGSERPAHDHAIVILVERARVPEAGNAAREWVEPAREAVADMRAAEIMVCIGGHIRNMGIPARAHFTGHTLVDAGRLAVLAGLAVRDSDGRLHNPYIGEDFALAVVTTDYPLATDRPLHVDALKAKGFAYWWGQNGAQSGRERNRKARRATHLSRYPMEQVKRIARPSTLILDDEVPRVPKRAGFFQRALHGDLGEKAKTERARFAFKTPLSLSLLQVIKLLVPFQDGPVAPVKEPLRYRDHEANAQAIKSLSYALGSDLTGVCEVPRYAWYSKPIKRG